MSYCLPKKKIKIEKEYAENAEWIKSLQVPRPQTLEQYLEAKITEKRLVNLVLLFRANNNKRRVNDYKNKDQVKKLYNIAFIKLKEIQNYFKPTVRYRKINQKRGRPPNHEYYSDDENF